MKVECMNDRGERPRVVVIDDDAPFLALMSEILHDAGFRAFCWPASRGAIEQLRRHAPAAVIVDLWLEDRTAGWRLLEALRAEPFLRHLPVVVCSADVAALRERADDLTRAGWRALAKPFDLDELLRVLAALSPTTVLASPGGPDFAACRSRTAPDAA
jgi:CheY-like chemotaxis protein